MTSAADHRRAILLLVGCGLCWSTGGVLIKLVAWHPLAIWATRCAIAAGFLWLVARPSLRGLSRTEWLAGVTLAACTGLFIAANKLTTAANAILIQYSAPVWVALLARALLGERTRPSDWLTIAAVLGGVTLFFVEDLAVGHQLGNAIALTAGVAFAINTLALRRVATTRGDAPADPMRPLLLGNLIGVAVGAPFCFAAAPPDAVGWGALLGLGVVQQGIAYLLYARAIRHATALEAMLIPVIEPILSPLWVALAVGELPGPWALVGGAIVVGAVTLRAAFSGHRPQASS